MRHLLILIFILACTLTAHPQTSITDGFFQGPGGSGPGPQPPVIQFVNSAPTGSTCALNRLYIVRSSGVQYMNILGSCTPVGGGSSGIVPATVQGDLLYASAANTLSALAKNTSATRYLSNTGSSNNPAWAQINAANGLTGTTPVANGGTGAATLTGILQGNGTSAFTPATATNVESPLFCSDAGANDTYACSLSPAIAAYATGTHYRFKANTANTGAASINFNAKGAVTIVKVAGGITTALADNDVRAGQWVDVVYDGTNMQMQSLLGNAPSAGITGSLTAPHVPVATGASALGDSVITVSGTRVDINLGSPNTSYLSGEDGDFLVSMGSDDKDILLAGGDSTLDLNGISHTATITAASGITLDSGAGATSIGDVNNSTHRTKMVLDDPGSSLTLSSTSPFNLILQSTVTAGGTTGAQTINKTTFSVNFAATATSLVVTNSLITANTLVLCTVQTNDATLKSVQAAPTSGSVTLYGNAAAAAETRVACIAINQ